MERRQLELPSARNVVAGQKFIQECPLGLVYDRIKIMLTNITHAQMTDIEVVINGKTVQYFASGTDLQNINDHYTRPSEAGVLTLFFERPEMREGLEGVTSLGTSDVQTLEVRGELDGAVVSPAITCVGDVHVPRDPNKDGRLGLITKIKRFPFTAVAGLNDFDRIVRGPELMAAHFVASDVERIEVESDSRQMYEGDLATIESFQKDWGRTPQNGVMTAVDFIQRGYHADALVTNKAQVSNQQWKVTKTAGGSMPCYTEYLDSFSGI